MRLTNRQLDIVVDEIFKNVSQPIINENARILDSIVLPKEPIMRDKVKYDKIMVEADEAYKQYEAIKEKAYKIAEKYIGKELNGINMSRDKYLLDKDAYSYYGKTYSIYLSLRKEQLAKEKSMKYPSRSDIERKVILSESKEMSELIDGLIKEYTK